MSLIFWIFFQARPINAHDLSHIDGWIRTCNELLVLESTNPEKFNEHAEGYGVNPNRLSNLIGNVKREMERVRDSGEIPAEYADVPIANLEDYLVERIR